MADNRPSTPPRAGSSTAGTLPRSPLTPEQVRRIEMNRLKAKAIRDQNEARARGATAQPAGARAASSGALAGQKRSHGSMSRSDMPSTVRDGGAGPKLPHQDILPARNFSKYVEYDFSKMTDTKGGFLTAEDDPHNKALHKAAADEKPAHMTLQEWERLQLLRSLRNQKAGPFEPGLSVLKKENKTCKDCGSLEIDWKWEEVFGCRVCNSCKEKLPEKYSLLTKTEAREDYLLTEPELKDPELLPHLERPNPHKSTWNNMMLYLRYQIEEYAFSPKKWGSPEALDAQFAKRESEKKKRKEDKFRTKLQDLKKRTRVEAHRRSRARGAGGGGGEFGDDIGGGGRHQHEWGRSVENPETGIGVKTCIECGMEVEELEF
ncbi:MAG: hypothetical protein M1832_001308 [Thelocarpon impressellum]|nr:MAG: hypothetical protein M1832_001308 [Thelocarpon impressellum]